MVMMIMMGGGGGRVVVTRRRTQFYYRPLHNLPRRRGSGSDGLQSMESLLNSTGECIEHCEVLLSKVRSPLSGKDVQKVVSRLDDVSNSLCCIIDYAEAASRLYDNPKYKEMARKSAEQAFSYMSELNADRRLYDSLRTCLGEDKEQTFLDKEARRVGVALERDFEISGIGLSIEERSEFMRLQIKIQTAGQNFELQSNPMKYLFELARLRYEASRLLGFSSYADLYLQDKVLSSPEKVVSFLEKTLLSHSSLPFADSTTDYITTKGKSGAGNPTNLSLSLCIDMLRSWCINNFSIDFKVERSNFMGRRCHNLNFSSRETGEFMGNVIVLCNNKRTNEENEACHYPIRTWRMEKSENTLESFSNGIAVQTPICAIVFNAIDSECLSFSELASLFHEFGHSLQTVCAKTRYHHLSGTRCKLDFAEVPSTLMELVLQDKSIFQDATAPSFTLQFDENYDSWRRSITDNYIQNLQLQVLLAKFDQFIHGKELEKLTSQQSFERAIESWIIKNGNTNSNDNSIKITTSNQRILLGQILRFRHLFNYGAAYYSYIFCNHVSRMIWDRLFKADSPLYNPKLFRDLGLARGGTRETGEILLDLGLMDTII